MNNQMTGLVRKGRIVGQISKWTSRNGVELQKGQLVREVTSGLLYKVYDIQAYVIVVDKDSHCRVIDPQSLEVIRPSKSDLMEMIFE